MHYVFRITRRKLKPQTKTKTKTKITKHDVTLKKRSDGLKSSRCNLSLTLFINFIEPANLPKVELFTIV